MEHKGKKHSPGKAILAGMLGTDSIFLSIFLQAESPERLRSA
jgi:hypothetical protein